MILFRFAALGSMSFINFILEFRVSGFVIEYSDLEDGMTESRILEQFYLIGHQEIHLKGVSKCAAFFITS